MPQPPQQHGQRQVAVGLPHRAPAAAQRYIEVVAQPGRQGDVPAVPEILQRHRAVGVVEVLRQGQPQQQGRADGDVAVGGEVTVDLDRVAVDPEQQLGRGVDHGGFEHPVHQVHRQKIRHDGLLQHAEDDQKQPLAPLLGGEGGQLPQLGQKLRRPHDGPGHQLGEEGHEEEEVHRAVHRLQAPAVDVDGVAEGLEGVKGDAHGHHHVQHQRRRLHPEAGQRRGHRGREEVEVLEHGQQPQVAAEAAHQVEAPLLFVWGLVQPPAHEQVQARRGHDEDQVGRVPPGVEEVGGRHQQQHSQQAHAQQGPVADEDDAEQDGVLDAAEVHGLAGEQIGPVREGGSP